MFTEASFTVAKIWKQPKCSSIDEWINKMWYMFVYIYIYNSAIKKELNLVIWPFGTTWMDLEGIMLSEISQTEKNKYCVISLVCGI